MTGGAAAAPAIAGRAPAPIRSANQIGGLRGEWVQALYEGAADVDLAGLCRTYRIAPSALREPVCRVPLGGVADTLECAARRRPDRLLGLHLAQERRPRGLLHYMLISQEDVGAAIERLVSFSDMLLTGETIRVTDLGVSRKVALWPSLSITHRQIAEACLAIICADIRDAARAGVHFEEVHLRGAALEHPADYEEIFGCPVRFGQSEYALVLHARSLSVRMLRGNRYVADRLEREAALELEVVASRTVRQRVEAILRAALRERQPGDRAAVAQRLVCSPRALRRALEAEGISFREIEEHVRRDRALALVRETELSLAEVAGRCGFASLPAFSKAFRRWTVRAPSAFRQLRVSAEATAEGLSSAGVTTQGTGSRRIARAAAVPRIRNVGLR